MLLLAGVLGDNVKVTRDKTRVTVTSEIPMSKRSVRVFMVPCLHLVC